jgi:glycosyltransferase involved in cell wall biosynthesis
VLVVPHVVNAFTDSLDPIKVYEYLAAGRPIVSTPVAGFRELDPDSAIVVPADGFSAAVATALSQPGRSRPAPAVATWQDRAVAMRQVIDDVRGA